MAGTWIMVKREFRSYFLSPIAYVIGALFLAIGGFQFFRLIFIEAGNSAEARMVLYFNFLPSAFLILAPALTMRQWAEERKLGTMELLLTFPVQTLPLILGKFMAGILFICVLLGLTLPYAFTLASLGNLDWGPVVGGYLGAILLACAYLSFGLFASSITRDQIIALIISVVFLAILYALGTSQLMRIFFGPELVGFFTAVSPITHFASIARGVLDLSDLIYYVLFCGFFLFANSVVIEIKKWMG
ncbi:MAG: ABC transporter permease subunit [Planctomycetota bacterium]